MTKTDSPDPVAARANLTYTVTVQNNGPAVADGVALIDQLPDAAFVSATPSQGSCARGGKGKSDGQVTCDFGTLGAGATATVTIVVQPSRAGATLTNTATVRANPPDPDRANNTATETTVVGR